MKGHRFMALTVIWLVLGYGGLGLLLRYEKSPAETVDPLKVWPVESVLVPRETTLLLFAHPHCPCTRASIEELARIMARCPATARVYVLFIQPEDVETDWAQTDLWRSAERIPGVVVVVDHGGSEAQRFHCRTSGPPCSTVSARCSSPEGLPADAGTVAIILALTPLRRCSPGAYARKRGRRSTAAHSSVMTSGGRNNLMNSEAPPNRRLFDPARAAAILAEHRQSIFRRTDRLLIWLMAGQWLAGVIAACLISPMTWIGKTATLHPHVWAALLLGGLLTALPAALAADHPGQPSTRHAMAAGQMFMSALFVHLSGGRIETHFHIFGSLAILAFYRDWKVLVTASVVVASDHFARGLIWPQSVYGVESAPVWRAFEHAGWMFFEEIFLFISIRQSVERCAGSLIIRQRSSIRTC